MWLTIVLVTRTGKRMLLDRSDEQALLQLLLALVHLTDPITNLADMVREEGRFVVVLEPKRIQA